MRILLVDNHDHAVVALVETLATHGYTLTTARDADEGRQRAHSEAPDIVFLDLPSFEQSLDLLASWRRSGLTVPILMFGRRTSLEHRVRCFDLGADACLAKPVNVEELLARLRALTRILRRPPAAILRTFDLEVNTLTRQVTRATRPLHLTPQEYELLLFLLKHRGEVVTRTMIREHLYADESKTSNVVDVYIRYLRNKLDRGFDPPLVITVWGKGYTLREEDASER